MKSKAFTLIELLVVIAIIAILAAILFPVFAQAKAAAKKTACLSNMKQLATASYLYNADFEDTFPLADLWEAGFGNPLGFMDPAAPQNAGRGIYPYSKNMGMMQCPSTVKNTEFGRDYSNDPGAGNTSYMYNAGVASRSNTQSDNVANLIVWQETPTNGRTLWSQPWLWDGTYGNGADANFIGITHEKNAGNYAFADGHAKYQKRVAVTFAMYGYSGTIWQYKGTQTVPNTTHMSDPLVGYTGDDWQAWGKIDLANTQ
jgi:prepilin-type N-terminal cleavage/methylation domain-containing protein/prepilin-type processing-associated H-X9-DG protein